MRKLKLLLPKPTPTHNHAGGSSHQGLGPFHRPLARASPEAKLLRLRFWGDQLGPTSSQKRKPRAALLIRKAAERGSAGSKPPPNSGEAPEGRPSREGKPYIPGPINEGVLRAFKVSGVGFKRFRVRSRSRLPEAARPLPEWRKRLLTCTQAS